MRRVLRPGAVRDRLVEARLGRSDTYRPRAELSWPLDEARLDEISIAWPERYFWPPTEAWLEPLRRGLAEFVRVERTDLPQTDTPVVVIRVSMAGETHEVGIDYSDYTDIDETIAASVPLYFKMQHLATGYGERSVVPGGYVPNSPRLYDLLGGLRGVRSRPAVPRLFGRFSPNNDVRRQGIALLEGQQRFEFDGGLALQRYGAYLAEAARSAACLDLPGRGPLCFRLIDLLAIGCCIVGPPHEAVLHVPLEPGVHLTATRADLSNLVDAAAALLEDEDRRAAQQAAAADFFDRYLERRQLAAYYLHEILARIA
ncbi:MAG: hypothetical protein H0X39_15755 [Actinobacteria bacterium]|nr:hypothetical protein [Actinomycetota bacterium]